MISAIILVLNIIHFFCDFVKMIFKKCLLDFPCLSVSLKLTTREPQNIFLRNFMGAKNVLHRNIDKNESRVSYPTRISARRAVSEIIKQK
jgi:hypothetical protein